MSTGDTPLLVEVLEAAMAGRLARARTSLPGRILTYDAARRRATVQLLPMDRIVTEDAERQLIAIAPIVDAPVLFLGSGTVRVKIPIRVGDPCWAMFSSSAIARLKAGSDGTAVFDPGDDRHHHEADAVIQPIPSITGTDLDDDDAMIEFTEDGLIKAGGDEPLVKRSEFLAHTHLTAGTGPATPPTSTATPGSSVTFPGTDKLRG